MGGIFRRSFAGGIALAAFAMPYCSSEVLADPTTRPLSYSASDALPCAFARFVPERKDDIAWENDRLAFRVYGPALQRDEPPPLSGSGIDVWVKSTRRNVINDWYKSDNYHIDHGDGLDFFNVGASRGCGGLGVWADGKLFVSGNWQTYQIKQGSGDKAIIELQYALWNAGGRQVSEKRTISLAVGSNLNRVQSVIQSDQPGDIVIGIGVTRDPVKGSGEEPDVFKSKEHGVLSAWSKPTAKNGSIGYGVVVDPAAVIGFERDGLNDLILIKVKVGEPFVYYTGACWSKGQDFRTADDWTHHLLNSTRSFMPEASSE